MPMGCKLIEQQHHCTAFLQRICKGGLAIWQTIREFTQLQCGGRSLHRVGSPELHYICVYYCGATLAVCGISSIALYGWCAGHAQLWAHVLQHVNTDCYARSCMQHDLQYRQHDCMCMVQLRITAQNSHENLAQQTNR